MAVLGGLEVDGAVELQVADNDTGSQVKVVADDLDQLVGALVRGAVRVDVDGERLGDTNGVRELDEGASRKAGSDQGLGDPAPDVRGRAIDLGEILAGEGTATVGAPTAIGVDNDLAASETGVALGATNDPEARGLDLSESEKCFILQRASSSCLRYSRGKWSCRQGTWREWPS